jgi:hypothetical protein
MTADIFLLAGRREERGKQMRPVLHDQRSLKKGLIKEHL